MNNEYQIEGERKETYSVVARRSEKQIKGKKIGTLYSYIEKVLRCWTHNETEREKNCKEETDFFFK